MATQINGGPIRWALGTVGGGRPPYTLEDDMTISEEKVKRLTDAFLNAYNAGDAARAASFYAENAV